MLALNTVIDRTGVVLRRPTTADAPGMLSLVRECPPLEANPLYCYLLLTHHFAATCRVAVDAVGVCALVTGYQPPAEPGTLFVWQVAVAQRVRGQGLAGRLLRDVRGDANVIETTIPPCNTASDALFRGLARDLGAELSLWPLFPRGIFACAGDCRHQEEILYRIGPVTCTGGSS